MSSNNQLTMAWRFYSEDNDGNLVGASGHNRVPNWTGGNWLTKNNLRDRNNWDVDFWIKKQNLLYPYAGNSTEIFNCPSDNSVGINQVASGTPLRSRSINNWVGGPGWSNSGSQWRVYRKDTDMVDPGPSNTFVLLDEREDSINDGYFVVDMAGWPNNSQRLVDYPASYHNNAAGFSFADGHSEIHKWLDKRTTPKINKGDMQLNVSMVNSVDLLWMMEKSTRKKATVDFDFLKKPIQPDGLFHALGQTHYGLRGQSEAAPPRLYDEVTEPNGWVHFFASQAPLPLTVAD